ncbi:hypothetical protein HY948_05185 [Candidatus Gottesmanbacteria bacterium]|nr:hypothetical protein [Candidatus Gottesmanbacteria bacterium]
MGRIIQIPLRAISSNKTLWQSVFWEAWEPLPIDQKLAWILLISNTIAILTLIEFLILH